MKYGPMMHVGSNVSGQTRALPALTKALKAILDTSAGDEVKKAAIAAISKAFTVENITISGCTFSNKP